MKPKTEIKAILYALMVILILIVIYFVSPVSDKLFSLLAVLGLLFLILGAGLVIIGRKENGKLRLFLVMTGLSAVSPLIFSVLHNVFYALAIAFEKLAFIFEPLHAISFIISLIVAPIVFIVGFVGSLILLGKKR